MPAVSNEHEVSLFIRSQTSFFESSSIVISPMRWHGVLFFEEAQEQLMAVQLGEQGLG